MKKILPVVYPSITSWTWHADLFSILEQHENTKDWIFSNYIQIRCGPDLVGNGNRHCFEFIPGYNSFLECPVIHTQYIDRKMMQDEWKTVRDFLCYCINEGYYVYCVCNERYLLHVDRDHFHELFIYGYDDDENIVNIADFTLSSSGRYSFGKAPFDLVCKGIAEVDKNSDYLLRWEGGIILAKPKDAKDIKYHLDVKYIEVQLKEYIQGVNSLEHLGLLYNWNTFGYDKEGKQLTSFGIGAFQYLIECLNRIKTIDDIDLRPFHNLYDHKKLMRMRVEYLIKKSILPYDMRTVIGFKKIENEADIACKILMKVKIKKDFEAIKKTINIFCKIEQMEKELITSVLDRMSAR